MRPIPAVVLALSAAIAIAITPTSAEAFPSGERPFHLGLGGSGAVAGLEDSGVGYFHLTLGLRLLPVVPEVTIREGFGRDPTHHLTSIAAGARVLLPKFLMLRGSFRVALSHQHEIAMNKFVEDPGAALFGVHDATVHRTGFETGVGLDVKLDPKGIVGIYGQFNAIFLPASAGPPFYVLGETGLSLAFGPTG